MAFAQPFLVVAASTPSKVDSRKGWVEHMIIPRGSPLTKAPPNLIHTSNSRYQPSGIPAVEHAKPYYCQSLLQWAEGPADVQYQINVRRTRSMIYWQRFLPFFPKEVRTGIPSMEIHLAISLCAGDLASSLKWTTMHILSVRISWHTTWINNYKCLI